MTRITSRLLTAATGGAVVAAVVLFAPHAAAAESDEGLQGGYSLDCSGSGGATTPVLRFSGTLTIDNEGNTSGPSTVTDALVYPGGARHEFGPEAITLPAEHSAEWPLEIGIGRYLVQQRVGDGPEWSEYQSFTLPGDCPVTPSPTAEPTVEPSPGPAGPAASISAGSVSRNGTLVVSGHGFAPDEPLEVWLHSAPVRLWSGTADSSGGFSQAVTIPASTQLGAHQIEVRGTTSASQWFDVNISAALAETGVDLGLAVVTVGLLAGGAGVLLSARGRRGAETQPTCR